MLVMLLTKKTFTENEIAEGMKREDRQVYFALRFCAKEAVFKSLGLPGDYIRMNEIEIRTTEIGQPSVCLNGEVKIKAADRGITQVLLSLSSDSGYVMAFAVAQGLPS